MWRGRRNFGGAGAESYSSVETKARGFRWATSSKERRTAAEELLQAVVSKTELSRGSCGPSGAVADCPGIAGKLTSSSSLGKFPKQWISEPLAQKNVEQLQKNCCRPLFPRRNYLEAVVGHQALLPIVLESQENWHLRARSANSLNNELKVAYLDKCNIENEATAWHTAQPIHLKTLNVRNDDKQLLNTNNARTLQKFRGISEYQLTFLKYVSCYVTSDSARKVLTLIERYRVTEMLLLCAYMQGIIT